MAVLAKTAASPALGLCLRPSLVPLSIRCPSFSTPLSSHPWWSGGPFPRAAGTQAPGLGLWGTGFQPPGYVAGAPGALRTLSGSSCAAPWESRGVRGPGSGSILILRDIDVYALSYCGPSVSSHWAGALLGGRSSSAGQERHLPQCADTLFQTPFFPWACSFCPGAPEGPGVGFSIIMEVTAWCLLI